MCLYAWRGLWGRRESDRSPSKRVGRSKVVQGLGSVVW